MTLTFSTTTVDEREQLEYWREVVCATFVPFDLETPERRVVGFRGEVSAEALDGMWVAKVVSEPHAVDRPPLLVRRSSEDDYLVNLAVRGRITVAQDGREALLRPGDLAVYDSARPCRIAGLDPFELLVLKVPRTLFEARCPLPRNATATPVRGDHGAGALLSTFFRSLTVQVPGLSPDVLSRVGGILLDLVAAALAERLDTGLDLPRAAHLARARRYIIDNIADPDLSPAMVAHALGVSVRYLHMLFRDENTSPFRWILEQRLDRAARLLADPRQAGWSVANIAFSVGFKDASHFTRTFKNRYGLRPRDYRAAPARRNALNAT
ncbi:AraC-like ligand-binding domain-containing protein [Actinomadura rudentiformis]|uniref:Helix-turn-helix domain-containing protein n=1 Tax=Actinomadura rudentiformis TaxID=359158 RepID=A0A6H9YT81_9ACTN|nr:helix-turn-helix domain-containing protein [Actinomadura rudentiformis]KAB2343623.1 helix-turn-helix domain-containing protein [Actinomadura rudentiformis]